jgi:undecaprenyl-diphosphatase
MNVLLGTVAAFLTGYASLRLLLGMIRRGKFHRFAYYCWGVGALSLILSLME